MKETKQIILISMAALAGIVLLSLPAVFWPGSGFFRAVAWLPLTLEWLLYYAFVGLEALFWAVAVLNVFVGGYTSEGWGRLVLCLLIGMAFLLLFRWVLMRTGFVPFSDRTFTPLF